MRVDAPAEPLGDAGQHARQREVCGRERRRSRRRPGERLGRRGIGRVARPRELGARNGENGARPQALIDPGRAGDVGADQADVQRRAAQRRRQVLARP